MTIPKPIITYGGKKCINLISHKNGSIEVVFKNGRRKVILAIEDCDIEYQNSNGKTVFHPRRRFPEELTIQIPNRPLHE